ncbi:MAG: metallophosphoesterase [Deltaproteobacteria bacterium]|nr:metallophosphoesterase [Deltaproteobacteria bacterium]
MRLKLPCTLAACAALALPSVALAGKFEKGPWLQNVTTDSIVVVWEATQVESITPSVEYGLTTDYTEGVVDAAHADVNGHPVYTAAIAGLSAETTYHYRVRSGSAESLDATFRTAPAAGASGMRIYVVGDNRSNPSVWSTIARLIHDDMNMHPDSRQTLILNTGDVVADGREYDDWDMLWPPAQAALRVLPLYVSFGNHEDRGGDVADGYIYGYFDLPYSTSGSTDEKWYSLAHGNVHVTAISLYDDAGYTSGEQYDWIVSDLAAAAADADTAWTVGLMHFTPWSLGSHDEADAATVRDTFHPLFRDNGVQIVFGGHNHIYARYEPVEGVTYITCGGAGASLHTDAYDAWSGATLAHFAGIHSFCIVDVGDDVMAVRAVDLEGAVFDRVTLGGTETDRPPFAEAGPPTMTAVGEAVTLDGSGSFDPEDAALAHAWTQIEGPSAVLDDETSATPSFTPAAEGRHTFELIVSDGTNSSAPDYAVVDVHAGVLRF